ncbi:chromatin-remodeling ATPase INO80-like isoform X1 [Zingiber officinale]|uniref:chromatin-remodeling ATPase INO80-like isoform X1 n=1 Tax=Zingiber officinale TaxID=94328 RepID=UPI001C4C0625|nr:chromatin-remodeling ATPase INO80-like isoform X1 [Zingiber officinale]
MEPRRHHSKNGLSYSSLFNLEPLMTFRVPQGDDDFHSFGDSSHDENRSSQDQELYEQCNGERSPGMIRRRQRRDIQFEDIPSSTMRNDTDSNDEIDEDYENGITEEQYRAMLSEHMQRYRTVMPKDSSAGLASTRMGMPGSKRSHGSKRRKFNSEPLVSAEEPVREMEISPGYYGADFEADYDGGNRYTLSMESSYLDIGEGITYRIPPTYDKLVSSLNLPNIADIIVEENYLKGPLDLRSLAAMISTDKRFDNYDRGGLGEPQPQYESLQARLRGLPSGNSDKKFTLKICDIGLDAFSIPEGAAGRIRRHIMSDSGTLQVYYVKVLERGDTYEIIERSLPKKIVVKKDPSEIEKEEMEKIGKVWANMVRRDIPKHHKILTSFHKKQLADAKRFSETCQREVKLKVSRSLRFMRSAAVRTRRLARDMLIFWKKVDKEQAELRKKEERDAAEALKREEELREAKRQQQRLNFLISQTELYSHFMGNKSSTQPAETASVEEEEAEPPEEKSTVSDFEPGEEEDPEEAELKKEALRAAKQAVSQQKKITNEFDNACLKFRQVDTGDQANDSIATGPSNIDLLNPSTMPVTSTVQAPEMFKGRLKEYQLKGLQWLVNCYEQGLNGILADEMGLGKTIQAMAFLAHLAEEKNIWGPFLVVAPSSVLNNWADEISRFCPEFITLPYWGGIQERAVLRKNINAKRLYRKEARFHILITSYQLIIADEKYLRRLKWQYMVLDEAQAIKSSQSIRWKTLLSFNCRNRLLLTGTPIQNNMAELWALLHFIMPTLFDSHEQFNEWFSKGIESHAEHGGTLNEHQLNRLHGVLKPFMLRRVKKDVISEMTGKKEITVHCNLSSRQQAFYRAIKNKISLAELFDGSRGHMNEKKINNLMNIVIQLRKVCNHPELFERNEGSSYFCFAEIPNSLLPSPFGGIDVHYAGNRNPILYEVPKLVHQEMLHNSGAPVPLALCGLNRGSFGRLFDIFSPDSVYHSGVLQHNLLNETSELSGTFGFTRLLDLSPGEVTFLAKCSLLERLLFSVIRWDRQLVEEILDLFMEKEGNDHESSHLDKQSIRTVARMLLLPAKSESSLLRKRFSTGSSDAPYEALVTSHQDRFIMNARLLRAIYAFIPRARSPPIHAQCSDRSFAYQMTEEFHHPWMKKLFVGFARTSEFNGPRMPIHSHPLIEEISGSNIIEPVFQLPYRIFGSSPPVRSFDPAKMLTDSGKLQTLDVLLKRLRAENHRVLLFAQMTKMLNILEDYMNYRKYKYFRLDGSSTIMDRRDMVRDFQRRNDIFVFLLSTRAGGLGINLTAADTVIFYESDWNPTLDLQAMDRAHRLGQTKDVSVYRLICKETVEEKILHRASQKNTVQQLVMTGGHVQGDLLKPEDVVSLLLDDAQLEQKLKEVLPQMQPKERQKKKRLKGIRVDADGDVSLEYLTNDVPVENDLEKENARNRKRKLNSRKHNPSKLPNPRKTAAYVAELDEPSPSGYEEDHPPDQRPKRAKRPTKSVNENLEPAYNSAANTAVNLNSLEYQPSSHDYHTGNYRADLQEGTPP